MHTYIHTYSTYIQYIHTYFLRELYTSTYIKCQNYKTRSWEKTFLTADAKAHALVPFVGENFSGCMTRLSDKLCAIATPQVDKGWKKQSSYYNTYVCKMRITS